MKKCLRVSENVKKEMGNRHQPEGEKEEKEEEKKEGKCAEEEEMWSRRKRLWLIRMKEKEECPRMRGEESAKVSRGECWRTPLRRPRWQWSGWEWRRQDWRRCRQQMKRRVPSCGSRDR